MRVTEIVLHDVELPLVHSFETSSHRKSSLRHLLVEMTGEEDGKTVTGWGEIASPSGPFYASETTSIAWDVARQYLIPTVLGSEWDHPDEVDGYYAKIRGHFFAKAGINMAAWSLWTAARGVPLAQALGGTRESVVAGVSLGIEPTLDELVAQVDKHVAAGYPRVKLKIAPGWDVEPVRAVRATYPDLDVHVDANGAYPGSADAEEAFAVFRELDPFGLTMIEQPFHPRNLLDHARLAEQIETPVCLDESVETLHELRTAVELKAGSILNIKVSRMGGLTVAREAHRIASEAGWPVWCGGMHEFGVGRLANVAISSLPGFSLPSDVSASEKYYARDIISPPVTAEQGVVTVPGVAGLGAEVLPEVVAENETRQERFKA
ncbi:o-succinylbenzoate synthase [Bogoriella caseilytica]|uniref:o-succinylbenzoate synthase n=1 Tax=Bogoriella caseilytica TaxID=56055 RepID=A0A3N2BDN6_9MICO|nr:o-succinylbenzoate synthase [Bogoriella caseilytica]ROR73367.1 O-succinylbenzoate synthase [Bogoriella caseilytica]